MVTFVYIHFKLLYLILIEDSDIEHLTTPYDTRIPMYIQSHREKKPEHKKEKPDPIGC
jgi:hypothetical protein